MKFKKFIEDTGGDNGLMGFGRPPRGRKPSDGQPFKNNSAVGSDGNATMGSPTMGGQSFFMRKKMKKKMKKS